ncbi:MAG: menaquinone biosynthesis decarboxylase [Planctomycetaceae bacterium]|nr:menaquinone biosynthesis decarboxylase [Planctomycetaceae bacterium]
MSERRVGPPVAYDDLREFLAALEKAGELARVKAEVDPELEITEVADRMVKAGGPALLFERVKGSPFPVLINALGSERRMGMALGVERLADLEERAAEVIGLLERRPQGIMDKLALLPKLKSLSEVFPEEVRSGPCQEVVEKEVDLGRLPILRCWPQDAGRFITMPMVFSRDPESGRRNCGMYRLQVYDARTTGMHWHRHHGGAHHYARAEERGEGRIPVAVAVGADPASVFCAAMPLPPDLDEMAFAGFLRGKAVRMVKCRTVDLEVPASSEFVLEGWVPAGERRTEGPFGDHTGFYSLADEYPVFHVECVTRRKDPIYMTTIVGKPPMEDCWMARAIEHVVMPVLRKTLPEVVDFHMPFEGIFHNLALVSIRKSYPGHARKVMHALWGLGQAMFTKCIVVVDEGVDVRNYPEVVLTAFNHIDPERDIQFVLGPVETLDHASRLPWYGSKMGVDATRKWESEGFGRPWPDPIVMSPEVRALVDRRWKEYGLPALPPRGRP